MPWCNPLADAAVTGASFSVAPGTPRWSNFGPMATRAAPVINEENALSFPRHGPLNGGKHETPRFRVHKARVT